MSDAMYIFWTLQKCVKNAVFLAMGPWEIKPWVNPSPVMLDGDAAQLGSMSSLVRDITLRHD